jgi:hypothetical protein
VIVFPFLACAFGLWFSFRSFWSGQDLISGDLGDARFNTVILEHTWLWLKGVHTSLFDLPMYYPHPNAYAYSDYLFGTAPIYWFFRAIGWDELLSFQGWLIAGIALSFFVFYGIARRLLRFSVLLSTLGAYLFSFSVLRFSHLEHAQMASSFWILVSAAGLIHWARDPKSRLAIFAFITGEALQFITAYYYFWFWLWALVMLGIYFLVSAGRRIAFFQWMKAIPPKFLFSVLMVEAILVSPFLYHYLLAARELGRRGWVSITAALPRLQSWLALPTDHWQWPWVPFKESILSLPMIQEHYLSLGLMTWLIALFATISIFKKNEKRFLLFPIAMMFVLTFVVGRFSLWIFMSYLFPGGSAIRAVGRIQIFMLIFWVPVLLYGLQSWLSMRGKIKAFAMVAILGMLSECLYTPTQVFSRRAEKEEVQALVAQIPDSCRVIAFGKTPDYRLHLDAIRAAFATGRVTLNGYSGSEPPGYDYEAWVKAALVQADFCEIVQRK